MKLKWKGVFFSQLSREGYRLAVVYMLCVCVCVCVCRGIEIILAIAGLQIFSALLYEDNGQLTPLTCHRLPDSTVVHRVFTVCTDGLLSCSLEQCTRYHSALYVSLSVGVYQFVNLIVY